VVGIFEWMVVVVDDLFVVVVWVEWEIDVVGVEVVDCCWLGVGGCVVWFDVYECVVWLGW